jgi:glucose-1-phosphate thymidylyltransferase
MKGIILAGGTGSRLWPITKGTSKQLVPVYDKPLIFYPLTTLMSAGIVDILVITTPKDLVNFQSLLGTGKKLGINVSYEVQANPSGLADAFIIGEKFIGNESCSLILGDNIFYGSGLGSQLEKNTNITGALIYAYRVTDPERYGVVQLDNNNHPVSIEEKPKIPKSNFAIPGLYFYDNSVIEIAKNIKPSSRGEIEISSVNSEYLESNSLKVEVLPRGTAWLDTGTFNSLHDASAFVRSIQERQGLKIGCPEEIAYRKGFINRAQLINLAKEYGSNEYSKYLETVSEEINNFG